MPARKSSNSEGLSKGKPEQDLYNMILRAVVTVLINFVTSKLKEKQEAKRTERKAARRVRKGKEVMAEVEEKAAGVERKAAGVERKAKKEKIGRTAKKLAKQQEKIEKKSKAGKKLAKQQEKIEKKAKVRKKHRKLKVLLMLVFAAAAVLYARAANK